MAHTVAGLPDLTTKGFEKLFFDEYDKVALKRSQFFTDVGKITGTSYPVTSMNGFSTFPEFTGTIEQQTALSGYDTTMYFQEIASGYQVTQLLKDTDIYGAIKKLPGAFGEMAAITKETRAVTVFNEAFTVVRTGHTEGTAGTGETLCANSHASSTGGAAQDNYRTTTLSPTEMEAIRRVMVAWTSDNGVKRSFRPTMILCNQASAFYEVAFEIIGSSHKVDTDYNNVNFHQGRYKLIDWDYLDTNKFFVIDESEMKKNLMSGEIHKIEFFKDKNSSTLQDLYACYFNDGYQWRDWRFVNGSLIS